MNAFCSAALLTRSRLRGAAFLRVALSFLMAVNYFTHITVRRQIWGPAGQIDYPHYVHYAANQPLALYRYGASMAFFELLFWASFAIAILYMLGIYPRVLCWLFAITTYASVQRNVLDADGGQMLLVLLAFLLCFADSSRYLSVMRSRRPRQPVLRVIGNVTHNAAVFLITWQVAMVYAWAGFYKTGGGERRGSAVPRSTTYFAMTTSRCCPPFRTRLPATQ